MEITIIVLFVISILLFILSFFQRDRAKDVEKQLENVSIQLMQEMFQLRKKVTLLEEENMISTNSDDTFNKRSHEQLTKNDVLEMYEDGYTITEISLMTHRHEDEIEELLADKQ